MGKLIQIIKRSFKETKEYYPLAYINFFTVVVLSFVTLCVFYLTFNYANELFKEYIQKALSLLIFIVVPLWLVSANYLYNLKNKVYSLLGNFYYIAFASLLYCLLLYLNLILLMRIPFLEGLKLTFPFLIFALAITALMTISFHTILYFTGRRKKTRALKEEQAAAQAAQEKRNRRDKKRRG